MLGLGLLPAVLRRWAPEWLQALELQDAAQRRAKSLEALLLLSTFVRADRHRHGRRLADDAARMLARCDDGGHHMVTFVSSPVVALIARWQDWAYGLLAWRRLRALVEAGRAPSPRPPEPAPPGLVLQGVTIRPPGATRVLVRDLTLHLAPGEAWAVLGPNGVGKTTCCVRRSA